MNSLLEEFYKELKEHFKNCYSNEGACHWKTSLLTCQCNCKFCDNFKMKVEYINVFYKKKMHSELRYHSSNHRPPITGGAISFSEQFKNCDEKCLIYRFENSENVREFVKRCNEMKVEIEWKNN